MGEDQAEWASRGIDISKPSIARAYDAALGGKDNFEVDRGFVAELLKVLPESRLLALYNRALIARGVRFLAEQGVRQFLDLGSGLPSADNTHQVVQRVAPDARVVYVDKDPIVLAHGRALLAENDHTTVVTADLRDPGGVLGHLDVAKLIDFAEPVAIMLVAVLHHLSDAEDPQGIVDAYMAAAAPGSYLFVTHFCDSDPAARDVEDRFLRILGSGRFRSRAEIEAYFGALELVPPGVVPVPEWRAEEPIPEEHALVSRLKLGGIARKP